MLARRLIALIAALMLFQPLAQVQAQVSAERAQVEVLAQYYAQYYDVPLELVRRVINRESTFNPSARNGPYYGLMQILPQTARTMGFRGQPSDLLDAETNLIYAVKYLRGAWLLANGSHDRAVQLYAKGYYYEAKAAGLLEETGLRPGPATPAAPTPPTATVAQTEPAAPPPPAAEVVEVAAVAEAESEVSVNPLGFLPPERPVHLDVEAAEAPQSEALSAITVAETQPSARQAVPPRRETAGPSTISAHVQSSDPAPVSEVSELRPSVDLISGTFDRLGAALADAD